MIPRYPGGKKVIRKDILSRFPTAFEATAIGTYVEPFVGGGSLLDSVASLGFKRIVVNDLDVGVAAYYEAVQRHPKELISAVMAVKPTVGLWQESKRTDGEVNGGVVKTAVYKLILHACSHGGLGYTAGGPQGGVGQSGEYKIDCRWNPARICQQIEKFSKHSSRWNVTCGDFESLPTDGFLYADPPYVQAGPGLYRHSFSIEDHKRLREWADKFESFVISYDNHPLIQDMYRGFNIQSFDFSAGNNPKSDNGKVELLVCKN